MNTSDLFNISGKVALITGGSRGIGKTIAEAYAELGAKVVITGRRAEWLEPAANEFESKGFACLPVLADVSKQDEVERTVKEALDKFGQVDILVNNAGQTWGQPAEDMPLAKWQQILDVNLTGIFLMSQAVGRHMIEHRAGGRIINIASVAGLKATPPEIGKTIAYNTSKAGVIAFTRSLAREWGTHNILVNAIAPGWFETRMASRTIEAHRNDFAAETALGRLGGLDELKGAAVFLASPASSFITGQTLVIDGGESL
ncbi:MAG TPA: SDR family oxidoreductase [Chloroflexia bacterium]|nr:SDR family oxidoreductase [Chloroflexia bacterium]